MNCLSHLLARTSQAAMLSVLLAASAAAQTPPAAPAPAPAAPPPAAAAPAPAPAAPPPAAAAPAPQAPTKIDTLAVLYVVAATAQLCELDLSDSEDEKLQNAVDAAEEAAGLKDEVRDAMWNKVVADINRNTKKACAEYSTEAMGMIRALKD